MPQVCKAVGSARSEQQSRLSDHFAVPNPPVSWSLSAIDRVQPAIQYNVHPWSFNTLET